MNIDNLSDKNKSRLQSDINKVYNDKPISEKRLEIIISAFAEDGVEVTEEEYIKYTKDKAGVLEERTAIFHPTEGLGQYFAINKQPLSALVTRGRRSELNDEVFRKISERGVTLINITQDAVENKDDIANTLESALDNENLKGDSPPFNEEELGIIQGLLGKIKSIDSEKEYEYKESEWKQLKNISSKMSKLQVIKVQAREEYYNYWKSIHEKYEGFHDYITSNRRTC